MKLMNLTLALLFSLLLPNTSNAETLHDPISIRFLDDGATSPNANIEALAWMKGSWQSQGALEGFSGDVEHVILGLRDGQMPGLVRVMKKDDTLMMFEVSSFLEVDGTLSYRNRHFAPDLVAWQEPDDYVDRRLVAIEGNTFYFHGITFIKRGRQEMGLSFVLTDDDGKQSKYDVDYTKVPLK